jgi:hypothetical protein
MLVLAVEKASPLARKVMERQITASFDDQVEDVGPPAAGQHHDAAHEDRFDDGRGYDKRERYRQPVGERDDARGENHGDDERLLEYCPASLQHTCQRMISAQEGVSRRRVVRRVGEVGDPVHSQRSHCRPVFPAHLAQPYSRGVWASRRAAEGVLDGLAAGEEDIFPDPNATTMAATWRSDPKAFERAFSGA